jgi:predicted ATPase
MEFQVLSRNARIPDTGVNTVYLKIDHWNDYSFVTMFQMSLHDQNGNRHDVGEIKIGFRGQTTEVSTHERLSAPFGSLGEGFFSLGQSVDFYRKMAALPNGLGKEILSALRDVVIAPKLIDELRDERVFSVSLLRGISLSTVKGQFARVLEGKAELTDFRFRFARPASEGFGSMNLTFVVEVGTRPSTNIHAVIGRNGAGKTTLLNSMIGAITGTQDFGQFFEVGVWEKEIDDDYFSSLVSVSFSAFDPFSPPKEQPDPAKGTCYFYIGLKDPQDAERHRTIRDLQTECLKALIACFHRPDKKERWFEAIGKLGSDENFGSMNLDQLELAYSELRKSYDGAQADSTTFLDRYRSAVQTILDGMSSGHAVVLLTVTRLVATVEEKTLVLLDEPESHLHPPLLSAFVRALADLLHDRNGVAIIATHSPVVLQEIPMSCVWKINRVGESIICDRPTMETFGENVGLLTSEVFSLEVVRSGFHALLRESVESGRSYEEILDDYKGQLGFEGRAILRTLIVAHDRDNHVAVE